MEKTPTCGATRPPFYPLPIDTEHTFLCEIRRTEPTILYLDIGGLIKRRLESLSDLLPGHDVAVLVRKVPRLLTTNVSSLAQKVRDIPWCLICCLTLGSLLISCSAAMQPMPVGEGRGVVVSPLGFCLSGRCLRSTCGVSHSVPKSDELGCTAYRAASVEIVRFRRY